MDPMFPGGPPHFILVPPGSVPVPILNQVPVMTHDATSTISGLRSKQPAPVPTRNGLFSHLSSVSVQWWLKQPTSMMSSDYMSEERLQEKARLTTFQTHAFSTVRRWSTGVGLRRQHCRCRATRSHSIVTRSRMVLRWQTTDWHEHGQRIHLSSMAIISTSSIWNHCLLSKHWI